MTNRTKHAAEDAKGFDPQFERFALTSRQNHYRDSGEGQGDAKHGQGGELFAEDEVAQNAGNDRGKAHQQQRKARAEAYVSFEEEDVADHKTNQTGEGEPKPRAGRGVGWERTAAGHPKDEADLQQGEDHTDESNSERTGVLAGAFEEDAGDDPDDGGEQGGKFAEVGSKHSVQ